LDPWEEVARRYERLIRGFESRSSLEEPLNSTFFTSHEQVQLTQWLTDHVVPLAASFAERARFRSLATWSLRNLCPGSQTPVRETVVVFQDAFRNAVLSLLDLMKLPAISQLISAIPPKTIVSEEVVRIESKKQPQILSREIGKVPEFELNRRQLQGFLADKTYEFFRQEDFFLTQQEFVQDADGSVTQMGHLVSGIWPRLEPLGDLIARSGRQRIESRLDLLEATRRVIHSLEVPASAKKSPKFQIERTAHTELWNAWAKLRLLVFEDAASGQRDSCSAVTQVYAAYGATPELQWLGLPEEQTLRNSDGLPVFLRGFQAKNLFDRIARSVRELGSVYDPDEPETPVWHDAIASGALVLIDVDRRAYWEGKSIDLGKGDNNWRLLWLLADHARTCRSVTEHDMLPDDTTALSAMPTAWSRLNEKLPISLGDLVEPDPNRNRAYRLKLDSSQIRLFRKSK